MKVYERKSCDGCGKNRSTTSLVFRFYRYFCKATERQCVKLWERDIRRKYELQLQEQSHVS